MQTRIRFHPIACLAAVTVAFAAAPPVAAAPGIAAPHRAVLQARGDGFRLRPAQRVVRGTLRPLSRSSPYGLHGSGPALAILDGPPAGVTEPAAFSAFNPTNHGGPVQTASTSYAIYWDPKGAVMDKHYATLIDRYLSDSGRSALYAMLTQYSGSNGSVTASSTFGGSVVDLDPIPSPLTGAEMISEVENVLGQFTYTAGVNDEFFLILPHGALPANGYCAYHGGFSYNGNPMTLAVIPYADAAGCGEPYDFLTPNKDLVADGGIAEVSVAQVGMITDPLLDAWYDAANGEISDMCFENFGDTIDAKGGNLVVTGANGKTDSYDVPEAYSIGAQGCAPSL
jgi:hypothetical protein